MLLYWLWVRRRTAIFGTHPPLCRLLFAIAQRLREFVALHCGEAIDPGVQRRFFRTARLDALPAGVRDAIRRLFQQQRFGGRLRVDSVTNDLPKASMSFGVRHSAQGTAACVPEATPSVL